jgi:hypothetical protein
MPSQQPHKMKPPPDNSIRKVSKVWLGLGLALFCSGNDHPQLMIYIRRL